MTLVTRPPRSVSRREQLVITKIVTTLGVLILLLLGAAGSLHSEATGTSASPVMAVPVDAHTVAAGDGIAEGEVAVTADQISGLLAGAAVCALGVLCGFALVIVVWQMLRRRGLVSRDPSWAVLVPSFHHTAVPSRSALSLTQLGISRT